MDDLYFDEPLTRSQVYTIMIPPGGWRRNFPAEYIRQLRPIAETLAMINHESPVRYTAYLQEADVVLRNETVYKVSPSWIRQQQLMQEDPVMSELWNKLQVLIALKEDKNGNV